MAMKVSFQGTPYWLLAPPDGDFGALAPLYHCDAEGNLLPVALAEGAAMYLYEDGNISREGEIVGARGDLKPL
jgi:hypothetical protein